MCPKLFDVPLQHYKQITNQLNTLSHYLSPLFLRLLLAVEFGASGIEKLHGTNWFIELSFPFPFDLLPADVSWIMATYFEIFGAVALALGLATRFFSLSLLVLTIVAIASVHWATGITSLSDLFMGYRIIDESDDGLGNYKLPLIYIMMLLPLDFARFSRRLLTSTL